MKVILKSKNGSIAIMTLVDGADLEGTIRKFQEVHPEYTDYIVEDLDLPKSRVFRDAWTLKDNKVVIDDKKAMKIHLSRIREERNKKLEELDREQIRNISSKTKLKQIEEQKQLLRDLPATVKTLDWPEGL